MQLQEIFHISKRKTKNVTEFTEFNEITEQDK